MTGHRPTTRQVLKAYVAHEKAVAQERGVYDEGDDHMYREEFYRWFDYNLEQAFQDGREEALGHDA